MPRVLQVKFKEVQDSLRRTRVRFGWRGNVPWHVHIICARCGTEETVVNAEVYG